jgi:calcineurin-like phosphoesterase
MKYLPGSWAGRTGTILPEARRTARRKGLTTHHFTFTIQRGADVMKNRNIVIHFLVILMLITAFAVCASTLAQAGATGDYMDDSVITGKIKTQLAEDHFLKSFEIGVETRKGIVQLSGFVDSKEAVDKAGKIARGVKGVKTVKNNLIVK